MSPSTRVVVPASGGDSGPLPGPPPLAWGVLGATSVVARHAVIPAIRTSPKARLVATASLSEAVGDDEVAGYRSYEELLADPDVEAVYIPLPNHLHREWTERAAAAGKHVLCEKPLAPTAADAEAMADSCRAAGVLLAEAYMTPFHPRARAIVDEVRAGRVGTVRHASARFSFPLVDETNHRWRPECGGGALLDVGIYCIAPLLAIAGRTPEQVAASAHMVDGVDASFSAFLDFGRDFTADVWCSFEGSERQALEIDGTGGSIRVETAFTAGPEATSFVVKNVDGSDEKVTTGGGDPYRGMIDHIQTVVRGGSSSQRSPAESVNLLALLDRLRAIAVQGAAA